MPTTGLSVAVEALMGAGQRLSLSAMELREADSALPGDPSLPGLPCALTELDRYWLRGREALRWSAEALATMATDAARSYQRLDAELARCASASRRAVPHTF